MSTHLEKVVQNDGQNTSSVRQILQELYKPNLHTMDQLTKYFRDTAAELKQVSWPTQHQAIMYTILVIGISAVVALYAGAFDYLFSQGVKFLINRF